VGQIQGGFILDHQFRRQFLPGIRHQFVIPAMDLEFAPAGDREWTVSVDKRPGKYGPVLSFNPAGVRIKRDVALTAIAHFPNFFRQRPRRFAPDIVRGFLL
jgi:hypothetical protein